MKKQGYQNHVLFSFQTKAYIQLSKQEQFPLFRSLAVGEIPAASLNWSLQNSLKSCFRLNQMRKSSHQITICEQQSVSDSLHPNVGICLYLLLLGNCENNYPIMMRLPVPQINFFDLFMSCCCFFKMCALSRFRLSTPTPLPKDETYCPSSCGLGQSDA